MQIYKHISNKQEKSIIFTLKSIIFTQGEAQTIQTGNLIKYLFSLKTMEMEFQNHPGKDIHSFLYDQRTKKWYRTGI